MKIALIGATGYVGANVLKEALKHGHTVVAIARNTDKVEDNDGVTKVAIDIADETKLVEALAGSDIVVSAFNAGWTNPDLYNDFIKGSETIQTAAKQAGVSRLLVVGGAGSLFIDGKQLVDSPQFPAEWKTGATAARDYLTELRKEEELDWTFLSPAIDLHPGERTGQYRIGTESPVFDDAGKCSISVEDLAVAIVDEAENKQFAKKRFTVGY
ncbi:NAD(P)-dependent oxidoreductase [Mucilaginibacter agri]|nr:NAD(P)-dependent oxidoreductase [Mucilaginibacter agri]